MPPSHRPILALAASLMLGASAASAQPGSTTQPSETQPADAHVHRLTPRAAEGTADTEAAEHGVVPADIRSALDNLVPRGNTAALAWFAVIVILVLTLRLPSPGSANLDGLVLALVCLLVALRGDRAEVLGWEVRWWSVLLLTLAAGYFLIRGAHLMSAGQWTPINGNLAPIAQSVLLIAALIIALSAILRAPETPDAHDAFVGGTHLAETGRLPYGLADGHDARAPLLYLLYGGVASVVPRGVDSVAVAHLANLAVFALLFVGLWVLGRRLHSPALGLTLPTVFCVFPDTFGGLSHPDILLPAMLLTWAIVLATLPAVGGLLSLLAAALAGFAWPWAWLTLPVFLGYALTRGVHALGGILGLLVGLLGGIAGLVWLTAPVPPRPEGAMRLAGQQPEYRARLTDDGTLVVERYAQDDQVNSDFRASLWRWLLEREDAALGMVNISATLPAGVDANRVLFRRLAVDPDARDIISRQYQQALSASPVGVRAIAALRTVLGATWRREAPGERVRPGTWQIWESHAGSKRLWTWTRRGAKVAAVLLSLLAGLNLLRRRPVQVHQLVGGLIVVCAAVLIVSIGGAATNWVWLLPAVLAGMAVRSGAAPPGQRAGSALPDVQPGASGPAPRITVNT
jgi:hypothetical protein